MVGGYKVDVARTAIEKLRQPFNLEALEFRVLRSSPPKSNPKKDSNGVVIQRGLVATYATSRAYESVLDAVFGTEWGVDFEYHEQAIIARVTISGVTRSASADVLPPVNPKDSNAVMTAESRAFKRACSGWGLGRYLYSVDLGWITFPNDYRGQPTVDEALATMFKEKFVSTGQVVKYVDLPKFEEATLKLGLDISNQHSITQAALGWTCHDMFMLTNKEAYKVMEYLEANNKVNSNNQGER